MGIEEAFGSVLIRLRSQSSWTQERLSFESGIDRSFLSELENGHKAPSLATVFRVAAAIGVSASDLVRMVEEEMTGPVQE